jgi:hypothetical protein
MNFLNDIILENFKLFWEKYYFKFVEIKKSFYLIKFFN